MCAPATDLYALADEGPYGFEHFMPGPGEVYAIFAMQWSIPTSAFAAVDVQFHDQLNIPVTWTR